MLFELTDSELQMLRSFAFVAALAFAAGVERLCPHGRRPHNLRVNGALWLTSSLALAVACGSCGFAVARHAAQSGFGLLRWLSVPAWLEILVAIAALDLVSYAWHRANHKVGFLWRFHQVHHSDDSFTVATGLRFHPGELLLSLPVRLAATALLGVAPVSVLIYEALFATANLFEHGDIDLPGAAERRLGRVLVIPAFHRRHHSQVGAELNSNFGTIFVVWDRWLGTFRDSSSADRVATGLPGVRDRLTPVEALLLPLHVLPSRR